MPTNRTDINKILNFFDEIKIKYEFAQDIKESFVPHIKIKKGVIHFDYAKVLVLDLLHEGGHLALIPEKYRHFFDNNLYKGFQDYAKEIKKLPFDHPAINLLTCCDDNQVTAWAWAVGVKLELKAEDVIPDFSYENKGQELRESLELKNPMGYIGVAKLQYGGYTNKYNAAKQKIYPNEVFYPNMIFWTADQAIEKLCYQI
jgi:hypothetical protein